MVDSTEPKEVIQKHYNLLISKHYTYYSNYL